MHRKRKGPKSTRAGCLLCKPHKHERASGGKTVRTPQEHRAVLRTAEELEEVRAAVDEHQEARRHAAMGYRASEE